MLELSYGIIWADIVMAKQGIEVYKNNTKLKDIKNMCAYHLQQAVEKLIKIQIYKSGIKYDDKSMYSHNISSLLSYANSIGVSILIPQSIFDNSTIISTWEAGSRYDLHFAVRIDTLEKSLAVVEKWYYQVKKVVK
jgi:HEPN domain-containing protein